MYIPTDYFMYDNISSHQLICMDVRFETYQTLPNRLMTFSHVDKPIFFLICICINRSIHLIMVVEKKKRMYKKTFHF